MIAAIKYLAIACFIIALILLTISLVFYWLRSPSHERQWGIGQEKLPSVELTKGSVRVQNFRDYDWLSQPVKEQYKSLDFDLAQIESVSVGVSHFSKLENIAHVFIVFGLKGHEDIALSVEARRSNGEEYTITGGLTFSFDLAYFLASTNDLLSVRQQRNERVYLYKTIADESTAQAFFVKIAERVNELYETPEFYHILFKNCASQVIDEIEKITEVKFPFFAKTFSPGSSGKVLFEMGLIDTVEKDFGYVKAQALVDK